MALIFTQINLITDVTQEIISFKIIFFDVVKNLRQVLNLTQVIPKIGLLFGRILFLRNISNYLK
jgi:hypothetical protein